MADYTSLATLAGGGAMERFNDELNVVLANICDPNTKAEAVREITLKVKIRPHDNREVANVEIVCTSKCAPAKMVPTVLYIGMHQGEVVATEKDLNQPGLFDTPEPGAATVLNKASIHKLAGQQ